MMSETGNVDQLIEVFLPPTKSLSPPTKLLNPSPSLSAPNQIIQPPVNHAAPNQIILVGPTIQAVTAQQA